MTETAFDNCPVCGAPLSGANSFEYAPSPGWQDISTAPKDGTQFLALLSNGWYELLRCRANLDWPYQWWTATGNVSVPIVDTHPADTDWSKTFTILATHWMPLPSPPLEGGR